MRKSQLIALLSDPDLPDVDVFISTDAEGNGFSAVDEVSFEPDDADSYFIEEIGAPALIIWPA